MSNLRNVHVASAFETTYFDSIGLVYVDSEPIIDLSQLEDTKFIKRRETKLTFRIAQISTELNVGAIENVE